MQPHLLIFDCDGVLLDSEALSSQAWSEVLARHGIDYDPVTLAERYSGYTDTMLARALAEERGLVLPDDIVEQVLDRALALFATDLRPIGGMPELLRRLPGPRCVASNSNRMRLRETLRMAGLSDFFAPEAVFSAQEVAKPKPAPDLHLYAARTMGVPPERCLVIEDSVTGVEAARAAGIPVIGFLGASHSSPEQADLLLAAGAAAIAEDAAALGSLLPQTAPA